MLFVVLLTLALLVAQVHMCQGSGHMWLSKGLTQAQAQAQAQAQTTNTHHGQGHHTEHHETRCLTATAQYGYRYVRPYWLFSSPGSDVGSGSGSAAGVDLDLDALMHPLPVPVPLPGACPSVPFDPLPDNGRYVTFKIKNGFNNVRQTFLFALFLAAVTNRTLVLPQVKNQGPERPFGGGIFDLSVVGVVVPLMSSSVLVGGGVSLSRSVCNVLWSADSSQVYWARPLANATAAWSRIEAQGQLYVEALHHTGDWVHQQTPRVAFVQDTIPTQQWTNTWGKNTHTPAQDTTCSQAQVLHLENEWGFFEEMLRLPTPVMNWWHRFERAYVHYEPELFWFADQVIHILAQRKAEITRNIQHQTQTHIQQLLLHHHPQRQQQKQQLQPSTNTHNPSPTHPKPNSAAIRPFLRGSSSASSSSSSSSVFPLAFVSAHWRQSDFPRPHKPVDLWRLLAAKLEVEPFANNSSSSGSGSGSRSDSTGSVYWDRCSGLLFGPGVAPRVEMVYIATEYMYTEASKQLQELVQQFNHRSNTTFTTQIQHIITQTPWHSNSNSNPDSVAADRELESWRPECMSGVGCCVRAGVVPVRVHVSLVWWSFLLHGSSLFSAGQLGPSHNIHDRDDYPKTRLSATEQIICAHATRFIPTHRSSWSDGVFRMRRYLASPEQFQLEMRAEAVFVKDAFTH